MKMVAPPAAPSRAPAPPAPSYVAPPAPAAPSAPTGRVAPAAPTGRGAPTGQIMAAPPPPPPPAPTLPGAPLGTRPLAPSSADIGPAMARMSLTENLLDGGNAVAAISQGLGLAQQKAGAQAALQNAAAAAGPSAYASGFQTTPSSGDPGDSGGGDDGSQDDGGGDDGSSTAAPSGGGDDGGDDGGEADFQSFVSNYYATNQAGAAPADPNAAATPDPSQQVAAAPAAQGAQGNGSNRPHPHRGFFARLFAALSGEDDSQAAQTQQAIVSAVQQSRQVQQQAQVDASGTTGTTDDTTDSMGLEVDGGWTRNNQDWSPSSYGADPSALPGQGPVSVYAQNGVLTATGITQSPYGKLPVCAGIACPVPMNNGPVPHGVDPEVDNSVAYLKQILFDKSLYEAQRDAAAHLVLSARLGDQVARATLEEIGRNAKKGNVRAASAQAIILDFIRKNPVDESGFAGDTSDAGSANPLQRSVNQLADGPALSAGRVRAIATSFGGGSRRRRAVVFHGMTNHDDSPETVAACDKFAARLTKIEKELHHIGRLIGRARGLQMARRKNGKISDFDKRSGRELGEQSSAGK